MAKVRLTRFRRVEGNSLSLDLGTLHSIGLPIHVYPLYENAFRAHRNQSIPANDEESAHLYGGFAKVAEGNSLAWNYGQPTATATDIQTVTKRNRMICFPCKWFVLGHVKLG